MEITGTFVKTISRNNFTGNTIFSIKPDNITSKYVLCEGIVPTFVSGTPVCVTGDYDKNLKFIVTAFREKASDPKIIKEYLSSALFSGIGDAIADKIINFLKGKDLFECFNKAELPEIPGLSKEKLKSIKKTLSNTTSLREFLQFASKYNITYLEASTIFNNHGKNSERLVKEHPYKLAKDGELSIFIADKIAKDSGISECDIDRIDTFILYAIKNASNYGHTFVSLKELPHFLDYATSRSAYPNELPRLLVLDRVEKLAEKKKLVMVLNKGICRLYTKETYDAEVIAAREIKRLLKSQISAEIDHSLIADIEKSIGIEYESQQRNVFNLFGSTGLKIITGGPGTGKTTTLKGVVEYIKAKHKSFVLCAPTGRAAQRLSEVVGEAASTIHKLLDIKPYGKNEFTCKDKDDPIMADFIIIDESSMLGIEIFSKLLNATKNGATVILVGDIDQLNSVQPGDVLHDLLKYDEKKEFSYELTAIYRQSEQSSIVKNAIKINHGDVDLISDDSFRIAYIPDNQQDMMSRIATEKLCSVYNKDKPYETEVLTPIRKEICGATSINKEAQKKLNSSSDIGRIKKGDKIIFMRNNYTYGYYNGDIGIVKEILEDRMFVILGSEELELEPDAYEDITLAYAITIHKSQGSEYSDVIIVLPRNGILQRNILYTAVTRAKNRVLVIAEGDKYNNTLIECIKKDRRDKRNSSLLDFLAG